MIVAGAGPVRGRRRSTCLHRTGTHLTGRSDPSWSALARPGLTEVRPRESLVAAPVSGARTSPPYPDCDKTVGKELLVSWIVLVVSGVLEAVWATALGKSEGFSRPWPTTVFAVTVVLSMVGLAFAMRSIPTGTAYAVWVGIGAALTVGYAMATGVEAVSLVKVLLILGLVGCVVGLKLVH